MRRYNPIIGYYKEADYKIALAEKNAEIERLKAELKTERDHGLDWTEDKSL